MTRDAVSSAETVGRHIAMAPCRFVTELSSRILSEKRGASAVLLTRGMRPETGVPSQLSDRAANGTLTANC